MKTLPEVTRALRDLDPHNDATMGKRRLAQWEHVTLLAQASEFADVRNALGRYDVAGVRYTVALAEAASHYAAMVRDSRPDSHQEAAKASSTDRPGKGAQV